jgi:hypothetical protein
MNELITIIVLDGLMAMLLMTTIYICMKLNKRVQVLQNSKSEFSRLIERFDDTTRRAQDSIKELQNVSRLVNEQLSERFDKANFLADDLAFMIERGNKLADSMEVGLSNRRNTADSAKLEQPAKRQPRKILDEPVLDEEVPPPVLTPDAAPFKRRGIEAMLNRATGRNKEAEKPEVTEPKFKSKSERELYDALKSGKS